MKLDNLFEAKAKNLLDVPKFAEFAGKNYPGTFYCNSNQLTSLEGAPSSVGGFYCSNNQLTSLEGAPSSVGGTFYCSRNQLTSLKGAPSAVGGYFDCGINQLTSLEGAPSSVGGTFYCNSNQLTSLKGAPSAVSGDFYCGRNQLTSLEDIHKQIKEISGGFYATGNPIKSHVLGVLLIHGVTEIKMGSIKVQNILNGHLPSKGMESVLECQDELIDAGLEDFAKL
jgi:hypothetical protein